MTTYCNTPRFVRFVEDFTKLIKTSNGNEDSILYSGQSLLKDLITNDDWLHPNFSQPHPDYYQQYLLHCDPDEHFSVVSFVWGPGQKTPDHDHKVWALIGMMRGSEKGERFSSPETGRAMELIGTEVLLPGDIDMISKSLGDIHRVSNAFNDRVSISIHVYGGNIGRITRHIYDVTTGISKNFISGYANQVATI